VNFTWAWPATFGWFLPWSKSPGKKISYKWIGLPFWPRRNRARTIHQSISSAIDNQSYSRSFWRNVAAHEWLAWRGRIMTQHSRYGCTPLTEISWNWKCQEHVTPSLQQLLNPGHGLDWINNMSWADEDRP
jgi:hypothetical protein